MLTIGGDDAPTPEGTTTFDAEDPNVDVSVGANGNVQIIYDGPAVDAFDYNITGPDNETIYRGEEQFDSPTEYYEGDIGENVTNASDFDPDDLEVEYAGEYSDGGAFNGSTAFESASLSFGPAGGPGGGGGVSQLGGIAILGVGALAAYQRFGPGLGQTVSRAVEAVRDQL